MSLVCPKCKSTDIAKKGFRKNRLGRKQKYRCCECKSWFVKPTGFERMRHKPEIIVRAVHMYADGMSLFKVQTHLWQHDGVKVCLETINRWCKKYSDFLKSNTRSSKAFT